MYDPPTEKDFPEIRDNAKQAYDEGYFACQAGKELNENPYKTKDHERETTSEDELYYWWWDGWADYDE